MNYYAYFMASSAALGGFLFGYEIGIIATILAMDTFNLYFDIQVKGEKGTIRLPGELNKAKVDGDIVLTFLVGCMAGAILVGYLADRVGRKRSILIGSFLFVVGAVIQTVARVLATLYAGRLIGGLGIGILSNVVPLYISETSPSNIRGTLISIQQLMITIGIFFANVVNLFIYNYAEDTEFKWRLALALQAVPGVGLFLAMCFMPVSPRWLANNDRNAEALTVLAKMRRSDPNSLDVQEELTCIKESIQEERLAGTASIKELLAPGIRNRIALVVVLQFFQQFSGINVIMYFAPTLFLNMGFSQNVAATVAGTINAAVNVLATFPGMYLVDRWGRRKLLIAGGILMGLSHSLVTVFTKLAEDGNTAFSYLGAICIYLFVSSFAFSWGPIVWVYQSEIFPLRTRGRATAIGTFANWVANGIVGKVAPLLLERSLLGNFTYIIFATIGFMMAVFTYFFVPETKGYTLETVNHIFDKRTPMGEKDSGAALNSKV